MIKTLLFLTCLGDSICDEYAVDAEVVMVLFPAEIRIADPTVSTLPAVDSNEMSGGTSQASAPSFQDMRVLAFLVFLPKDALALVRDDHGIDHWHNHIGPRLRVHGPWDQEQVVDYFVLTYGLDQSCWPLRLHAIERVFTETISNRAWTIVRLPTLVSAQAAASFPTNEVEGK